MKINEARIRKAILKRLRRKDNLQFLSKQNPGKPGSPTPSQSTSVVMVERPQLKAVNAARKRRKKNPCWRGFKRTPRTTEGEKGSCQKASADLFAGGPGSGPHKGETENRPKKYLDITQYKNISKAKSLQLKNRSKLSEDKLEEKRKKKRAAYAAKKSAAPILSDKAKRAAANLVITGKEEHAQAEAVEHLVAHHTGGVQQPNNSPLDVLVGRKSGRVHGIEVKAILSQKNDKITMKREAMQRKLGWQSADGKRRKLHTLAVDTRGKKVKLYYKEGVGSFRLGTMQKLDSWEHLHSILT